MSATTAIEVKGLSKRYGAIKALSNVNIQIGTGEVIGLLGPNGAGKTTLMKVLTGYLEPDDGEAFIHGHNVVTAPLETQRRVGYLPENAPLYGEMLVQEYLLMMAELRGIAPEHRLAQLSEAVQATGLGDRLTQQIGTLSKGYRQRVGIAQAIIHKPEVLILDEPTTGLDPTQIAEIRELIARLAKNATVLLSTHVLTEVESTAQRVIVIMKGEVRADAKLAELRSANAAIVAVERSANNVAETLRALDGVTHVEGLAGDGDFQRWRITSSSADELCPALYQALKKTAWRVGELRPDPKTLERVFRELANQGDLAQ